MYSRGSKSKERSGRGEQQESPYVERVVKIRRVSKVVKGGRHLTFNALVVVGDGAGRVGSSLGRATAVPDAVRKGSDNARKKMENVVLSDTTIPHEVTATFGSSKVFLKPAAAGTGVIAGGGVRAVVEAVGIKDVLSKTFGSNNTINTVRATLKALRTLRDPTVSIARRLNPDSALSEKA